MLWLTIVAFLIAVVTDKWGFLTRPIGDRIAAVLALFAFRVWFRGLGLDTLLIGWGTDMEHALAQLAHNAPPMAREFLGTLLLPTLALILCGAWVVAMTPALAVRLHLGDVFTREPNTWLIWGGAFGMAVMVGLIPGRIGEGLQGLSSLGVSAGQFLVSWAG